MRKYKLYGFFLILIFTNGLSAAQITNPNPLQEMRNLRANQQVNSAIEVGRQYLEQFPKDADALLLMGLLYYQKKEFNTAKTYLNRCLEISPDYEDAKLALARIAIIEKDYPVAEDLIQELTLEYSTDPRVTTLAEKLSKARSKPEIKRISAIPKIPKLKRKLISPLPQMQQLRANNQLDKAIILGEQYLKDNPENADVLVLIGLMHYQKKDYFAAQRYLKRGLNIAPQYIDAKIALIRIAIIKKHYLHAEELLDTIPENNNFDERVQQVRKQLFAARKEEARKKISYIAPIPLIRPSIPSPIAKMKELREQNKPDAAITIGKKYLKTYPKDADVMYFIGLSYYQKQDFKQANNYLEQALAISPNYLDVKVAIIQVAIAEKNFKKSAKLLQELKGQKPYNHHLQKLQIALNKAIYQAKIDKVNQAMQKKHYQHAKFLAEKLLTANPNDNEVRLKLAIIYYQLKNYPESATEYRKVLASSPNSKPARIGLINTELARGRDREALVIAEDALASDPYDPEYIVARNRIFHTRHMHAFVAHEAKRSLSFNEDNEIAISQLQMIDQLNPHLTHGLNALSADSEIDYISDLKEVWQYTTAAFQRNEKWGALSLSLNNVTRFGTNANQGMINVYPIVNQLLFFRVTGGYANEPVLFPTYTVGGEAYFSGWPAELSAGLNYYTILPQLRFLLYTTSISKEIGDYWISFRPNFYRPLSGRNSLLYTLSVIRYFKSKDTYIRLIGGSGTSPDLANLTTVDFLVIRNNFIVGNIQFPLFDHKLLVRIGGDYQRWVFPQLNNRLRNISGGQIGFTYRFEDINNGRTRNR